MCAQSPTRLRCSCRPRRTPPPPRRTRLRRALTATRPGPPPKAPPVLMFQWGTYQFQGIMDSFKETIDFFSADGVALRALVSIGLSRQDNVFDEGANLSGPHRRPAAWCPARAATARCRWPRGAAIPVRRASSAPTTDWRACALPAALRCRWAAAAACSSIRRLPSSLRLFRASAGAGIGLGISLGASAGGSAGISIGGSVGHFGWRIGGSLRRRFGWSADRRSGPCLRRFGFGRGSGHGGSFCRPADGPRDNQQHRKSESAADAAGNLGH